VTLKSKTIQKTVVTSAVKAPTPEEKAPVSEEDYDLIRSGLRNRDSKKKQNSAIAVLGKFISLLRPGALDQDDWMNLILGLAGNVERQDELAARQALQKVGYKHEDQWHKDQLSKGKKPGPGMRNPTEDELDRLYANARMMLNMPKGEASRVQVLSQIAVILAADRELRTSNWLISNQEKLHLRWLADCGKRRDNAEEREMAEALEQILSVDLTPLKEVSKISDLLRGRKPVISPSAAKPDATSHRTALSKKAKTMAITKAIIDGMAKDLEFDVRAQFLKGPVSAKGAAGGNADLQAQAKPSLKDWKLSSPEVLRTALARLGELKMLVPWKQWCLLHEGLPEIVTRCLRCHPAYLQEVPFFIEVQDFFIKLGNDQGINPMTNDSIETFSVQDPVMDWEPSGGGPPEIPAPWGDEESSIGRKDVTERSKKKTPSRKCRVNK
jgi:hypothetical protein